MVILGPNCGELSRGQARFGPIWTVLTPNYLEGQSPATPFSIGFWRDTRYIFVANLVILPQKRVKLSCRQAHIWPIWPVLTSNDLEGRGKSTPFSKGFWRVPRYTVDANLVIQAQKCGELLCGQARFWPIWAVLTQMTLKVKVNQHYFQSGSRVFQYTFGANLVILAWKRDELSHRQSRFGRFGRF